MKNIKGFEISANPLTPRIININIKDEIVKPLLQEFKKYDLTAVEYKPFIRFSIAKFLDNLTENQISSFLNSIIKDRKKGCLIIGLKDLNRDVDDVFLVKLSTAISHLVGVPNHDSMTGKFYARFQIKHEDKSDSYLRKAYSNMDLHTDGTYVKEITDWLLMTKIDEKNASGGKSVMLHLDDWEDCQKFFLDPIGKQDFIWASPKSKNVDYKVEHPIFFEDKDKNPLISYIDQFPEPQSLDQGVYLKDLSDSLESCKNRNFINLKAGSMIIANNHFWLHGRQPFEENKHLYRELLRIRGKFYN